MQGTIKQIRGSEVTCVFGDAFDAMFQETNFTVQFNLSRNNYIRYHFASQRAAEYLGEGLLFPRSLIPKPPRIVPLEEELGKHESVQAFQVCTRRQLKKKLVRLKFKLLRSHII